MTREEEPHGRDGEDGKREELSKSLTHVLEECRMVLPGIQALFGFQLIAVFNNDFHEVLHLPGRILHLSRSRSSRSRSRSSCRPRRTTGRSNRRACRKISCGLHRSFSCSE